MYQEYIKTLNMKKALIVFAHQDSKTSFNAALKDIAVTELSKQGYDVTISDLYAQDFDPRATRDDFTGDPPSDGNVQYMTEAATAAAKGCLSSKLQDEISKVKAADLVIFQYPMYWFGPPAILKGWFDKVFLPGIAFSFPNNLYDEGLLKGKKAMLSLTTGSPAAFYSDRGLNGDMNIVLWSTHYGILKFCGFDVLKPQISYSPGFSDEKQRKTMLEEWTKRLPGLDKEDPMKFVPTNSFDPQKWFTMKDEFLEKYSNETTGPSVGQHLGKNLPSHF